MIDWSSKIGSISIRITKVSPIWQRSLSIITSVVSMIGIKSKSLTHTRKSWR